jgi:hypothetical protein
VLGFDGTHSTNDKYKGVLLTLIGRDGNGNNVTIAFAVVHSENEANIVFLFGTVSNGGVVFDGIPLFCNRKKDHWRGRRAVVGRYSSQP